MKFEGENILEFTDMFPDNWSCLHICQNNNGQMGLSAKNAGTVNLLLGRGTWPEIATGATM